MSSFGSGIPMPSNRALFALRDQLLPSYGAFYYDGLKALGYMLVRAELPEMGWDMRGNYLVPLLSKRSFDIS